MADAREQLNPGLLGESTIAEEAEQTADIDLTIHANPSIRSFTLRSGVLPSSENFLTNVIKQAMPNLEVANLVLGTRYTNDALDKNWQEAMRRIGFSLEGQLYVRD